MTRKLDWRKAEDNRILPQVLVGGLIAVLSGLFFFSIYPTSGPTEFIGTVRAIAPSFQDGPNLTVATVELDDGTQVVAQAGPHVATVFAGDRVRIERHEGLLGNPVIIVTEKIR